MASAQQTPSLHRTASHAEDVMARLHQLQQEGRLTDVTIKGQHGQVRCHSPVLCGNSAYFERMLEADMTEGQTKVITFPKVHEKIIENMVHYFYKGEIQITADNAEKCLDLAEQMEITALVEACTAFMVSQVDVNSCVGFYKYGSMHQLPTLVEKSENAILTQFGDVSKEDELLSLTPDELIRFIKDDSLIVKTEDTVYEAVMRWVKSSPETRTLDKVFVKVMEHVRFPFCSSTFLRDVVSAEDLMDNFTCYKMIQEAQTYHLNPEKAHEVIKGSRIMPRILTAQTDGDIVVFGGLDRTGITASKHCYKLNKADKEWNKLTELPTDDNGQCAACLVNNGILISGGRAPDVTNTQTCWFYVLKSGLWEKKADMILPRVAHTMIAVGGEAVCCGGSSNIYTDSVEKYSFALNKWSNMPNMLEAKGYFPAVCHDSKIYIFGGCTDGGCPTNRCQRLDVASQTWTNISAMPAAKDDHSAVLMDSDVFLLGGIPRVCYRYSINTDQFTWLKAPVKGYDWTAAVVHQGDIVLLGKGETTACVAYSVEKKTWSPWLPALPGPLHYHHAFNVI